jgi:hypothetical protein
LPLPGVGPSVAVGAGASFWSVEVHGQYLLPQTQVLDVGQASWSVGSVGVGFCPRVDALGFRLAACAGLDGAALTVAPHGALAGASRTDAIALASLGARVRRALVSQLFIQLAVTGLLPLGAHPYTYTDASGTTQNLYRLAAVAGSAQLGLGWAFE